MRIAINCWFDPNVDRDLEQWYRSSVNRSAFIRAAIKEKIARRRAAETREQETLDAILIEVAETRRVMVRVLERLDMKGGGK